MTEAQAQEYVKEFAQWQNFPELSQTQVDVAINYSRTRDALGRLPGETGYAFTVSPAQAVALAWELKAAKVAGRYSFSSGGQTQNRKEAFDNCKRQAKDWAAKIGITSSLGLSSILGSAARAAGISLADAYGALPIIDASDAGGGVL